MCNQHGNLEMGIKKDYYYKIKFKCCWCKLYYDSQKHSKDCKKNLIFYFHTFVVKISLITINDANKFIVTINY